jgi:hypothetical protein
MYSLKFMYDNYLFINHIKLETVFKMEDYVPPGSCCWRRSHTRWCTFSTSLVSNNLGTNHVDTPLKRVLALFLARSWLSV